MFDSTNPRYGHSILGDITIGAYDFFMNAVVKDIKKNPVKEIGYFLVCFVALYGCSLYFEKMIEHDKYMEVKWNKINSQLENLEKTITKNAEEATKHRNKVASELLGQMDRIIERFNNQN
jgi:hypothetical protein